MFDAITKACTAFDTYAELISAIDGGYCPTIYGTSRRQRAIIRILKAHGRKVWGNSGKFW